MWTLDLMEVSECKVFTAWYSCQMAYCVLWYLGLRGPSSKVFAFFNRTEFIAWCLMCSIRVMLTCLSIFGTAGHVHFSPCLVHTIKQPCAILHLGREMNKYCWLWSPGICAGQLFANYATLVSGGCLPGLCLLWQNWVHCSVPEVPHQWNADGVKYFRHLLHINLYSCMAPTIEQPCAIFWHGGMSDKLHQLWQNWEKVAEIVLDMSKRSSRKMVKRKKTDDETDFVLLLEHHRSYFEKLLFPPLCYCCTWLLHIISLMS